MRCNRVLVTGASGFVGSSVLRHLLSEGRDAVGLIRVGRPGAVGDLPVRELAVWDEASLASTLEGFDAVVHAASVVHRPDAPMDEYVRFNVEGTRSLVNACSEKRVSRLVLLSTIKVYGEFTRQEIDETTALASEGGYAETKVDAERIVLEAESLLPIVFRLAPVFGPGDKGNVKTLIRAIARRRFLLPGDGRTRKSLVHVSTVARVVAAALEVDLTGVFVLADRVAPSMEELTAEIARAVGRRRPLSVPTSLVRGLAFVVEHALGALGRTSPVSPKLIDKSLTPTVCSPAKLERALGVVCHVDFAEAIREEVEWMRRSGLIL